MTVCYQKEDGSSILLLVANGHHNCIKCTNADVRLRTLRCVIPVVCVTNEREGSVVKQHN